MNFQDHKGTWHKEYKGYELPKGNAISECGAKAVGFDREGKRKEIPRAAEGVPADGKKCGKCFSEQ